LLAAARLNFPGGAFAQGAGPEVTKATLGFIALSDAGPLFVAKDKGLFAKYGMPDVEVAKQASWGTTRDNLVLGSEGNGIDGAHILTPMPYLISAGKVTQNNQPTPMYVLARLNLNGQCISVAKEYSDLKIGLDTASFKPALEKKKASGKSIKAAMTFPGGTHDLWIRYWLAAGGIEVHTATYPVRVYGSVLMLVPAKTLTVDRVVSMPRARGVPIDGLPHDFDPVQQGGLGLQIVRSLVHEDLKGEFEFLREANGQGVRAVVSFPKWVAKAE